MLTPAIRAMNYFLLAPREGGHPTIPSQSVKPVSNAKPTRARVRRRSPVERDELQIGMWSVGVKRGSSARLPLADPKAKAAAMQRLTLDQPIPQEFRDSIVAL